MRSLFKPEVEFYLKADRQWPRIHRIRHAQRELKLQGGHDPFWEAVLAANGVVYNQSTHRARILASTSFTIERSLRNVET